MQLRLTFKACNSFQHALINVLYNFVVSTTGTVANKIMTSRQLQILRIQLTKNEWAPSVPSSMVPSGLSGEKM